ncbi:haloacid dehalogenase type II [Sphingomonas rubra]|uniref:(S)-2-haloacid dehalogenase n=1 Tax=Sphingomonas rubra TaxID=634430 RepID=A0A1I5S9I8_9SPHN|nr:haloacid dehalogenase type II [Sphingomonas rubra]SFP67414.1 2-haloacid dehalogenase [Sphingomonas rubra]
MRDSPGVAVPRALAFDVFGTVVDWRAGVARESGQFLRAIGRAEVDAAVFADDWRARYQPAMAAVRDGARDFVVLDVLHREMLVDVLRAYDVDPGSLDGALLDDWARAWHRLDPWPDAVEGLARLRAHVPVVTLSNGNVALMLAIARRGGLVWDAILGAEVTQRYKPLPEAYTATAAILGVAPHELCLVAAHHSDLAAARDAGLLTAYVDRPMERGGAPAPDRHLRQSWEWQVTSLIDLAEQLHG